MYIAAVLETQQQANKTALNYCSHSHILVWSVWFSPFMTC